MTGFPVTPNGKLDRTALPDPQAAAASSGSVERPHTVSQKRLLDTWELLLPHRPIGIDDDFFEIGGHSLLALRMLAEVERTLRRRVSLTTLFEGATIRSLADRLDASATVDHEPPFVVLQPDGKETPLIFLHGDVLGAGLYCRRLAPLLSPDLPLVVLPTHRADPSGAPLTIEAMAAHDLRTLREVQPHGPYRLGGFCVGGSIAYEMARQLTRSGEVVERLIMIDAVNRNAPIRRLRRAIDAIMRADTDPGRFNRRAALLEALQYYARRLAAAKQMDAVHRVRWAAHATRSLLFGPSPPSGDTGDGPAADLGSLRRRARSMEVPRRRRCAPSVGPS